MAERPLNDRLWSAASKVSDVNTIDQLLDLGADVDCVIATMTPLQFAIEASNWPIAKHLISRFADVNLPPGTDKAPLASAIKKRRHIYDGAAYEVIAALVDAGSDLRYQNPLYHAADQGLDDVVELLLKKGADPNGKSGAYPLEGAASKGHLSIVKLLIAHGVKLTGREADYALVCAVRNDQVKVIDFLLSQGANVNASHPNDGTLLKYAENKKMVDMTTTLLRHGAKTDVS